MPMTCDEMRTQGILEELIKLYSESSQIGPLFSKANIDISKFPEFGKSKNADWWQNVCTELGNGVAGDDGVDRLIKEAADDYPGNEKFKLLRSEKSKPDNRNNNGGNISINLPDTYQPDDVIKILDKVQSIALTTGSAIAINIGFPGSTHLSVTIQNFKSQEEVNQLATKIEQELTKEKYPCNVQIEPYNFRDYYSDPLTAEGPDGQRFALDQIRASTRVKDVARGVMNIYGDNVFPSRGDQKNQAVVDMISNKGQSSKRLDPTDTLHDAGVRPGDTLRVSPERTAGAINPMDRDAALARVRNEVLDFADAHPGFTVEANSPVAPTEYLFKFSTKGFAPSHLQDGTPRPIDYHEVLLVLPGDFPVQAPEAWWQTDIYHPNINSKTGFVCLGALKEQYRPALNIGELCQMFFDLAGYRNYAVTDALDIDAAKWALSEEGQRAIESIGGLSVIRRMVMEGEPEQKISIRKIQP